MHFFPTAVIVLVLWEYANCFRNVYKFVFNLLHLPMGWLLVFLGFMTLTEAVWFVRKKMSIFYFI